MFEVIPGILEKEWSEIERKIELVKPFAKTIHIDIIDGKFAQNTTFLDPKPFAKYSSEIFFELHMMVDNPIQYLKPFADVGFKRFIGHVEKMPDQQEFVAQGQLLGEVGLAIDGPTNLNSVKVPLEDLDAVLVYTSDKAGFSGASFMEERLKKVRKIREQSALLSIGVDGGINDQTIVLAKDAGATRFVSTTFIFNTPIDAGPKAQFNLLKERIR